METQTEKRAYRKKGGWTPKPLEEKKVMVFYTVKQKHFPVAIKAVRELCKQWR